MISSISYSSVTALKVTGTFAVSPNSSLTVKVTVAVPTPTASTAQASLFSLYTFIAFVLLEVTFVITYENSSPYG